MPFTNKSPLFLAPLAILPFVSASAAVAQSTSLDMPLSNPSSRSLPALRRSGRTLSSRGLKGRGNFRQQPAKAPVVLGKLATIIAGSVALRVSQDTTSRALSIITKGTHVAVVSDTGEYLGILMIDRSIGWIPRDSAELIDYQVAVSRTPPPNSDEDVPASEGQNERSADPNAPLIDEGELDPRTFALLREAISYMGVPYVWAGTTRAGLDCSAFVKNVYASQGISLPRVSGDQARVGTSVSGTDLRPGDRLYFDMGRRGRVSHCGIYLGKGYFIHASSNHGHVDVDSIFKPNYYRALVAARRSL